MKFLAFSLLLACFTVISAHAETTYAAKEILSGNEILLEDGNTLKLADIAVPGKEHETFAKESREALQSLVTAPIAIIGPLPDRYGRIAGDAYIGKTWLQAEMIKSGLAFTLPDENISSAALLKFEQTARAQKRGLWADPAFADTSAENSEKKYGQYAFVSGKVTDALRIKNRFYLNFGADWKSDFTASIQARHLRNFKKASIDPTDYKDKTVRIRGWIKREYGPMITVTSPEQIEIISEK